MASSKDKLHRKRRLLCLGLLLLLAVAVLLWQPWARRQPDWVLAASYGSLDTDLGPVENSLYSLDTDYGCLYDQRYTYADGTVFSSYELELTEDIREQYVMTSLILTGHDLNVKYYDRTSGQWYGGDYPHGVTLGFGMCFIRVDDQELIVCLPQTYRRGENSTVELLPGQTGGLVCNRIPGGWRIKILSPVTSEGELVDYFLLQSGSPLIDWELADAESRWAAFQFTGDNRWLRDGYYYISPSSYIPSGEYVYYQLTAAYIACKLADAGQTYPAGRYLGIAMLDTMCRRQNDEGWFPTPSGSAWLESYGVEPGFFDTRFNNDLVRALIVAYEHYGVERFLEVAKTYGDFLVDYAAANHDEYSGSGHSGWLVYDYKSEHSGKTHTSLNHQTAEMTLLEELYQLTGDERYLQTSQQLYQGIAATEQLWRQADGDLAYGLLDGEIVGQDYPYLTYNDLYCYNKLQALRTGADDPLIVRLMDYKLAYMENHGITGYLKD